MIRLKPLVTTSKSEFVPIQTKWEYKAWLVKSIEELNKEGQNGWELVIKDENGLYIFKRPILEQIKTKQP